ncbi:MAG: RluA family pseudouridine synthase [Eubacteriales bacterium]|nr:RluA family pseudouridine synthase [Eubacteriales bacterium]
MTYRWRAETAQTLLNFCKKKLRISAAALEKMLRKGYVRVNKKDADGKTLLAAGDAVEISIPAWALPEPVVLYADDHFAAVEKPPRMAVCQDESLTLTDLLQAKGFPTALPCHRLDAGTGGVVLFALDENARQAALDLFSGHRLEKIYQCIVAGQPPFEQGNLHHYLTKDSERGVVRAYAQPRPNTLEALADYTLLARRDSLSLLQIALHTGRTHQIRVQTAASGFPVLGDDKYGDRAANRAYGCRLPCLWAAELAFPDALGGVLAGLAGKRLVSPPVWPARCAALFE